MKWRQNYHLSSIIISNAQIEKLVSNSRSTNDNVNMSFPNSNKEETLVLMFFASHFDIIESWKLIVDHGYKYAKKIINPFVCVKVRILVEKRNEHEDHIFLRPLLQTCRLETTAFFLNTRLLVNNKFSNSQYFYWY